MSLVPFGGGFKGPVVVITSSGGVVVSSVVGQLTLLQVSVSVSLSAPSSVIDNRTVPLGVNFSKSSRAKRVFVRYFSGSFQFFSKAILFLSPMNKFEVLHG